MPRPAPSFVTLSRRKPATLAADEHRRWPDRWCAASSQDHGDDVCRRTGPATPMGGRAGLGAVGAGHARPGRGALDGQPVASGWPARPGRVGPGQYRWPAGGAAERGHRRGGGCPPPPPPPPAPPPAAATVARYYPATGAAALALLSLVLLLTPTGSLPSPRWRWWAVITAATPVALVLVVPVVPGRLDPQLLLASSPFSDRALGGVLLAATRVALVVTALAVAVAAGSLVVRFRRAHGVERQQLRWVALAAAVMVLAVPG